MGIVEFSRRVTDRIMDACGNYVRLEDATGTAYGATNPLPITIGTGITIPITVTPEEIPTAISGTVTALGPTVIVAAPAADRRLVVTSFVIQNEAATANLMQIHMGAATAGFRCNAATQDVGLSKDFAKGNEWRGPAATALSITNSAVTAVGYSVLYYTEAV